MSTIVIVQKNDDICIGADTLTKYGDRNESAEYIENHSKIFQIGNNYFALVGHTSWSLIFEKYFSRFESIPSMENVNDIFSFALDLHEVLRDEFYLCENQEENEEFESSELECLIANPTGIYALGRLREVQKYKKFYALGSGAKYAIGAMRSVYSLDFTSEEVAKAGLEASADFDEDTALPIELIKIKVKGQ